MMSFSHYLRLMISKLKHYDIFSFSLIIFSMSFQIHWNQMIKGNVIRLSLSDVLLVFMLILYGKLYHHNLKKMWAAFKKPLWFLIFTLCVTASLLISYWDNGVISNWAFINKFLGWIILIFYFFLGNMTRELKEENVLLIIRCLSVSSFVISIFNIIFYIVYIPPLFLSYGVNDNGRFIGLLINPNAYGLYTVFVVLLHLPYLSNNKLFPMVLNWIIILPNMIALFLSGSRTAIIAFIVGLISYVITNALDKKKFFIILLAVIIMISCIDLQKINNYLYVKLTEFYMLDQGMEERLTSNLLALRWWLERPLLGIGLGSFLVKQQVQNIAPIVAIHNTPLWLLTELGMVGLFIYVWFIYHSRKIVHQLTKENPADDFAKGMLMIFPAFAVASLTLEVFYQRYIWFFLGLILGTNRVNSGSFGIYWINFSNTLKLKIKKKLNDFLLQVSQK